VQTSLNEEAAKCRDLTADPFSSFTSTAGPPSILIAPESVPIASRPDVYKFTRKIASVRMFERKHCAQPKSEAEADAAHDVKLVLNQVRLGI
jgi:hypothetical protein